MDRSKIVTALNKKDVSQPCPRCSSKNFSVIGESEIVVLRPTQVQAIGALKPIGPVKTIMPTIIVTCDNCGYVAQHAQASLDLFPPIPAIGAIKGIGDIE